MSTPSSRLHELAVHGDGSLAAPPRRLRLDRLLVTAAAVVWIAGTLFGYGLVDGDGVEEQGSGLFSDSATLIAPHGPAFSIWSVIYLGLAVFVVWQWLPHSARSVWAARVRRPAAASIALNGIWLLVVFAGGVFWSVVVIAAIAVALGLVLEGVRRSPARTWSERLVVGGTFGLYLGWICVATCANVALWLVDLEVPVPFRAGEWITVALLVTIVALSAWLIGRARARSFRLGVAGAVAWGLAWVSVGRTVGETQSGIVAVAAGLAAAAVAMIGLVYAVRGSSSTAVDPASSGASTSRT